MQEKLKVIKTLTDVHRVASRMFPCGAKRIDETHGKGYMGVKLIVGERMNPIYDPAANPNRPGLLPEMKKMEEEKSKLAVPDVRKFWVAPGTTVQELIAEHLTGIKNSLEKKEPIMDIMTSGISKNEISDADIAAKVARGEIVNTEFDEDEVSEIDFSDGSSMADVGDIVADAPKMPGNSEIIEAITMIGKNMETLAENLEKVNSRIDKIETK